VRPPYVAAMNAAGCSWRITTSTILDVRTTRSRRGARLRLPEALTFSALASVIRSNLL
jgi:hypothetical protein